jgi:prepilin-type N-terminal cleavage/methylation domain-containing protein
MQKPIKITRCAASRRASGFTLTELMITLAIAAVLIGLGAPSFTGMLEKRRQAAENSALVEHLVLAREEAKNSASPMSLCISTDGKRCAGSGWHDGYIVFRDAEGPGVVDGGENLVRHNQAGAPGTTISATLVSNAAAYTKKYIRFDPAGKPDGGKAIQLSTCRTGLAPLLVTVKSNGNIASAKGTGVCA